MEATLSEPVVTAGGCGYSEAFRQTEAAEIAEAVRTEGMWMAEGAITPAAVEEIVREVPFGEMLLNANRVGVVHAGQQQFLSHCLAASKSAFDLIASERVLSICRAYFGDQPFKLTNQRIYQTHTGAHMPWHTDNNVQTGNKLVGKHRLPGLLFLAYLTDVTENPFEVLRRSHEWSKEHTDIYFSDRFVDANHSGDVLSFQNPRGTLFICDIHLVHRAKPFQNAGYDRKTLLFQVDAVSPDYPGHGEEILVNTAFVKDRSPAMLDYLGFGQAADYPTFPTTTAASMQVQTLLSAQMRLFSTTFRVLGKAVMKALLPGALLVNLKRLRWKLKGAGRSTNPA